MAKTKAKPTKPGDKPTSIPRVPPPAYKPWLSSSEYPGGPTSESGPSKDDPRWKTVLPFVRGVCALLPNEVPDADQQYLTAIAVRMSAFDRDKLLQILERGVA